MTDNVIGTSSYSEAMDLSDIDDLGYEQESVASPENPQPAPNIKQERTPQPAASSDPNAPPIKIRKKPGRKPNPASPALRKAQNRAAQRAFRERKERHMKDLENNIHGIKAHRDKLLVENQKVNSENETLKAENWYLKGIVLSLQLVCLQHNLVIPQHCPHVDDKTLGILSQSIPESISSYINVNSKGKLQISSRLISESSNIQMQQGQSQPTPQQLPSGSLIITQDGVHTVPEKRGHSGVSNLLHSPQKQGNSWYHQTKSETSSVHMSSPFEGLKETHPFNPHPSSSSDDGSSYQGLPPLSPMSSATAEKDSQQFEAPPSAPQASLDESVVSNLAAIQTLRLRLRLQSACVRMQSMPFAIQPTLLQLTIPHDPRIDLIPTPHMRDRMILYRDQFDLDDCFRCLLSGSVFHGGDPAIAGNWQLPVEFFEKYWFLTIDYNLRRYTNEWRKRQGLEEIKPSMLESDSVSTPQQREQQQQPQRQQRSAMSPPPLIPQPDVFRPQQQMNQQPPISALSYEDLSGYLGVHFGNAGRQQQPQQQQQGLEPVLTPVQLTNGYGMMKTNNSSPANDSKPASSPMPWDSLLVGQKSDYDLMMTGLYNSNNNDMDQRP